MTWKFTTTSTECVGQRQLGQVGLHDLHPRVAAADVGHGGLVVVQRDHPAGDAGDQVGAVTFAAARLEHVATRAARRQPLVDHLVAAKPVVLDVQAGDGAFTGQRQHRRRPGRVVATSGTNALIA